jgi:hypothetical protein
MKTIRTFLAHLLYHRETYFLPSGLLVLLTASAAFVTWLTGRAPSDDAGSLVGYLLNGVGIALVLFLTGQTQEHFFGYRGKGDPADPHAAKPPLTDDLFDAAITIFLLCFFAVLVFSLWR